MRKIASFLLNPVIGAIVVGSFFGFGFFLTARIDKALRAREAEQRAMIHAREIQARHRASQKARLERRKAALALEGAKLRRQRANKP
jgi:hypothetical protein